MEGSTIAVKQGTSPCSGRTRRPTPIRAISGPGDRRTMARGEVDVDRAKSLRQPAPAGGGNHVRAPATGRRVRPGCRRCPAAKVNMKQQRRRHPVRGGQRGERPRLRRVMPARIAMSKLDPVRKCPPARRRPARTGRQAGHQRSARGRRAQSRANHGPAATGHPRFCNPVAHVAEQCRDPQRPEHPDMQRAPRPTTPIPEPAMPRSAPWARFADLARIRHQGSRRLIPFFFILPI